MIRTINIVILLFASFFEIKAQIIITVAGGGTSLGDGGPASNAILHAPNKCVIDKNGILYFAEPLEGRIRKINIAGIINTVAGTGISGYNGDNISATSAELNNSPAIAFDAKGNLYIADAQNNRVRKVDIATGIITTVVGTGTAGYNGDNIPATSAKIYSPTDICFNKEGDLFISDFSNYRVRKVDTAGIITTVAGTGAPGFSGDGAAATLAQFQGAYGLAFDNTGNLYVADWNGGRIRKVSKSGIISTCAGTGLYTYNGDNIPATSSNIAPLKITFNRSDELCFVDNPNDRIRMIDNKGIIHTIAGNGGCCYSGDNGPADSAAIGNPGGITFDTCGNLYVTQVDVPRIRKVIFNPGCWPAEVPVNREKEIVIYPNPAVDELHIELVTSGSYVLMNITGIIEQQGTLKAGDNPVPINAIPPGMHLLVLTDEVGKRTIYKIMKQ